MCLGESTTFAQWPKPLEDYLNQKDIGTKFSIIDKGIPGTNTAAIVSLLEDNLDEYSPQMVIVMMGINDAGNVMSYEGIFNKKILLFCKSFRTYKLIKLLCLHIVSKVKEMGAHRREQEQVLEKATEINPESEVSYLGIGWSYKYIGKHDKAIEMFKKAIEINPESEKLNAALAACYREEGKYSLAEEYSRKAETQRTGYYNSITRHNYQKLKEIVTQRGIILVCAQYPMRSIEPLKKMLEPHDGIVFVDNERVFKDAVEQEGYEEYFVDMIGGDFGHCTKKGNRLLAENIAGTILKTIK